MTSKEPSHRKLVYAVIHRVVVSVENSSAAITAEW